MRRLLLILAGGAMLALSLPPYNVEWLGWLALAPLLVAVRGRRALEAVGMGLLAGVFCGFLHVGWQPGMPGVQFAYLPFLWLAMLLGVVAALAAGARRRWDGTRWVLFVACSAVAVEWLTTFSPLPIHLALCQYRTLHVIQIGALTGIWGVSFLLWWCNAALADAALGRRKAQASKWAEEAAGRTEGGEGKAVSRSWLAGRVASCRFCQRGPRGSRGRQAPGPSLWAPLGWALVGLALTIGYSHEVLARGAGPAEGPAVRVAAIQEFSAAETAPFVPAAARAGGDVDREELTRRAAARGAKLVVWSEGCLGATFAPARADDPTRALARALKTHLVVGYSEAALPKPFNAAAILGPDGMVKGVHRKIHPFLGERQAIQCGRAARAFDTALGKMGVEICFDNCATDVTRRIARDGAQIIAVPNWDPPTPHGILHRLHAAMLPFRAVENHVPFVRADANGLSQIVDPRGRILAQAPLYAADMLLGDVPLGDGLGTLYTRLGDWLAYVCVLVSFSMLASAGLGKRSMRI